ncbi:MAG: hypothetical protein ACRD11_04120 [Terriglobia bacterium]
MNCWFETICKPNSRTTQFVTEAVKQYRQPPPVVAWDVRRGLYAAGKEGVNELTVVLGERDPATVGPADALVLERERPDRR